MDANDANNANAANYNSQYSHYGTVQQDKHRHIRINGLFRRGNQPKRLEL